MSAAPTVLIVDDELHARANLRLALAALPGWQVAGECADAAAARIRIDAGGVDILLLDIQMPVESGLALARDLSRRPMPPLVVFVTADRGHALEAFDVHALDYLVKPVSDTRLRQTLERAAVLLGQRDAHARALRTFADPQPGYWRELAVRSVGSIERVGLDQVQWIRSAGNYVELHLAQRMLLHRSTLAALEAYLDPAEFLRIHRRVLVRRGQARRLRVAPGEGALLELACGASVPVSERYLAAVRGALRAP